MTAERRRPLGRIRAVLGVLWATAALPGWFAQRPDRAGARRLARRFFQRSLHGLGVTVEVRGEAAPGGTLFIANHVSWADVAVFGAVIDANFIAKADVAHWPLIGPLARRVGTLFVERERRHGVTAQAEAIRARLQAGASVILFAEGTTGNGIDLLPFRTSLFTAADAARRVQPVALSYVAPDGRPLPPERLEAIAWTGNEELLPNAMALVAEPTRAILSFLPPVDPRGFSHRKDLAEHCREAISAEFASIRGTQ